MQHVLSCLAVGGGILFSHLSYAQEHQAFKDRLTVGTNAFEWLLTVPNVRLELDLKPGPYNHSSALLGIRYNWNTYHQLPPYYVFNVFGVKGEYRYHFRFQQLEKGQKAKLFSTYRKNPRPWIAYYVGAYGEYSSFSIKFSAQGRQGFQGGVGVSAGMELPLYQYKGGAIDLDLGFSAGVLAASYQLYSLNEAATAYVMGGNRFIPLPMLTELRAVFNWRTYSVKDRYVKSDPQIPVFNNTMADIRTNFENTTKQAFDDSRSKKESAAYAKSDSLYKADFTAWVMENDAYLMSYIKEAPVDAQHMKQLEKAVKDGTQKVLADFDKYLKDKADKAKKAEKADQKEAAKAAKAEKAEKAKAEKAEKAEKAKEAKEAKKEKDNAKKETKKDNKKGKEKTAE